MTQEEIIELLKEYEGYTDRSMTETAISSENFNELAERIVKLFAIQDVSNMLPEELCKLYGHAMYSVYSINNMANGNSSFFGLNKCSRCGYEEPWQYDF